MLIRVNLRVNKGGAGVNNPTNSSNSNWYTSLNDFIARHEHLFNAGMSTLTFVTTLVGVNIGAEQLRLQREDRINQEMQDRVRQEMHDRLIQEYIRAREENSRSMQENTRVSQDLLDALNRYRISQESSDNSYGIVRTIRSIVEVGRNILDFRRWFRDRNERPSEQRNSSETVVNTPSSNSAPRERGRSRNETVFTTPSSDPTPRESKKK